MNVYLITLCLLACFAPSLAITSHGEFSSDPSSSPPVEIQVELEKASTVALAHPFATELALAPFRALRDRYPSDIFVQEGYQDAVQRYGVEGQLMALTEEYRKLDAQHDGSRLYHYLYLRSLVGYSTGAAIQGLTDMEAHYPDFAPAHQTLAAIYGAAAFRDAAREKSERQTLLRLRPNAVVNLLPPPLPGPTILPASAEKLLAQRGDPHRVLTMTTEGIVQDEWRWEHIHPHDWYTDDEKRRTLLDLRASYWKAWTIQVRCYRNMGQLDKADALLTRMDRSASSFLSEPGPQYWNAMATLVQLYTEANQREQAALKIDMMATLLAKKPDAKADLQLKALTALLAR